MANLQTRAPTHWWLSAWFLITIPIVFWDAGFCFFRPRSFHGGDLHWIWKPYALYQNIDYVYGVKQYDDGVGFTNAQSFLNIIENAIGIYYLYVQHVLGSPTAPLIAFTAVTMTFSKTVLYWVQEYFCNYCAVGHNNLYDLIVLWMVPNGLWLVFPGAAMITLWKEISGGLRVGGLRAKTE